MSVVFSPCFSDPSALVQTIMGEREPFQTPAMKHGLSLEPIAKRKYGEKMRKKHKGFKCKDSGLTIYDNEQFLAASVDLEITCDCCGDGICEIKCPASIKGSVPSEDNLKYVKNIDGSLVLDESHTYYYQVQGQMGILSRSYCDLFIFTMHGHLQLRVNFNPDFWQELCTKLIWFWKTFVLKELVKCDEVTESEIIVSDHDHCAYKQNNPPNAPLESDENALPIVSENDNATITDTHQSEPL